MQRTHPAPMTAEERRRIVAFAVEILEWMFPLAFGVVLLMIAAALI